MFHPLKIILFLIIIFITYCRPSSAQNAYSSTIYNQGNLPTDYDFWTVNDTSSCPGNLTVTIPSGSIIDSVDVEYEMTAFGGGYIAQQRSELWCISLEGTREGTVWSGKGAAAGTYAYSRTGLDIADAVVGGGDIDFQLHTGRTYGSSGCNITFNIVDNNTWKVTVYYKSAGLWLGYSTAWDDTGNWYGSAVPDINADVFIPKNPEGGNFPVISGTVTAVCDNIVIENGASLTIQNGGSLTSY